VAGKLKHAVMLSSTYRELVEHRQAIQQAILGQELFPIAMENDAALPGHDLISASIQKVDEADAYVGLISYRYGQVPISSDRNPNKLSLTELEFRRACDRGIPICMFIMHDEHLVPRSVVNADSDADAAKLRSFIALAKQDRIYAEFKSVDDLKAKSVQSLGKLREAIERESSPGSELVRQLEARPIPLDVPPGWEVVDRDRLAKARANPPSLNSMVQFFDGILPTWNLALARGVRPRALVERLADRFRALHAGASKPQVILLAGAGGEGKSTALLHASATLVEDVHQQWTCLRRHASNAELPADTFTKLPIQADHAWVIVIDDADNIGGLILDAVKKSAARTDIHVLLGARDADWQLKRLVPGMWQPVASFHTVSLAGVDAEDAGRIVAGWMAWGDEAMGALRGRSEADAVAALLGHASDFAARKEDGELLGALLATRHADDMRGHVRTLVGGLGREPVIRKYSLRDIYSMVAAMHAENQLFLSRSVLAFALGCDIEDLERNVLMPLRREAMLDAGATYVLTRHRRIAEAACEVMREDGADIDRWYPMLAHAARKHFLDKRATPEIMDWSVHLPEHFVGNRDRWPIARAVAKALYDADPSDGHRLTVYCSVLRDTERPTEALAALRATGERFRARRDVLYEWSTVASHTGDQGLAVWLAARSLADGAPIQPKTCMVALAGLGSAFRALFLASGSEVYAKGQAACGQLGLRLEELDALALGFFKSHVADGERKGISSLSPEQAIDCLHKAVVVGANEVEHSNDPVFFERLLGEPDGYSYATTLRMTRGAKVAPPALADRNAPKTRK
jgi:hypothetical protein